MQPFSRVYCLQCMRFVLQDISQSNMIYKAFMGLSTAIFLSGANNIQAADLLAEIQLIFPLTQGELSNIYVDVRVYEYDPRIADLPATMVQQQALETGSLNTQSDSLLDLTLSASRRANMDYYISARAYAQKGGEMYFFMDYFQTVFEGTDYETLQIRLATHLDQKEPEGEPVSMGRQKHIDIRGYEKAPLFKIHFESQIHRIYSIESTNNLKQWRKIGQVNGTGSTVYFTDFREALFQQQYYRVKLGE